MWKIREYRIYGGKSVNPSLWRRFRSFTSDGHMGQVFCSLVVVQDPADKERKLRIRAVLGADS